MPPRRTRGGGAAATAAAAAAQAASSAGNEAHQDAAAGNLAAHVPTPGVQAAAATQQHANGNPHPSNEPPTASNHQSAQAAAAAALAAALAQPQAQPPPLPNQAAASPAHSQEAAEQAIPEGPPGNPTAQQLEQAATQLRQHAGVSHGKAVEALQVNVTHSGNLDMWLEESMLWMACQNELQEEIEDVKQAMEVSLLEKEQQAREAKVVPAEQLKRYVRSELLKALRPVAGEALLLAEPLWSPLSRLLDLEHKCSDKWYPSEGTYRYFQIMAEEAGELCRRQLAGSSGCSASRKCAGGSWAAGEAGQAAEVGVQTRKRSRSRSREGTPAAAGADAAAAQDQDGQDGQGSKRQCLGQPGSSTAEAAEAGAAGGQECNAAAAATACTAGAATAGSPPAAAVDAAQLQPLVDWLQQQTDSINADLARMPVAPGQIPDMFRQLEPAPGAEGTSESSDCIILD